MDMEVPQNTINKSNVFTTPLTMPNLTRKPNTPLFDDKRTKKRALDLSPLLEASQNNEDGLINMLAEALLPALNKFVKQQEMQQGRLDVGEPFPAESSEG